MRFVVKARAKGPKGNLDLKPRIVTGENNRSESPKAEEVRKIVQEAKDFYMSVHGDSFSVRGVDLKIESYNHSTHQKLI